MIFGNRTLGLHLLRGAAGLAALYLWLFGAFGWPSPLLGGLAIWMLKGCPMCWTVGLFETLAQTVFSAEEASSERLNHRSP
jgi:fatty acid desaturase